MIEHVKRQLQNNQRVLMIGYECDLLMRNLGDSKTKALSTLSYETRALNSNNSDLLSIILQEISTHLPSSLVFNFGLSQVNGAELEQLTMWLADNNQTVNNIYLRELSIEGESPLPLKRKIATRKYLGNEWPGFLKNDADSHELFKEIDRHAIAWHLFSNVQLETVFMNAGFEIHTSLFSDRNLVRPLDKYGANGQTIGRPINEVFYKNNYQY